MNEQAAGYCLAFDLSTNGSQIGLVDQGNNSIHHLSTYKDSFGSAIADRVYNILCDLEIKQQQITRILVQSGPGSFTGIKVGLSFAYGLSLIHI